MALNAGDAACSAGLAKAIADAWTGSADAGFVLATLTATQLKAVHALCYAVASAVVAHITANAAVTVTTHVDPVSANYTGFGAIT